MKWIIEGAIKAIAEGYDIKRPKCVEDAVNKYQDDSDWLTHFLDECCVVGDGLSEKSGAFYAAYRAYCGRTGDFIRSTTDFYNALESREISRKKRMDGNYVLGVKLVDFD